MTETQPERSPLALLVIFMICLAIAGSCIAGAHYYTVDLPQQKATAPDNGTKFGQNKCDICKSNCVGKTDFYNCLTECQLIC